MLWLLGLAAWTAIAVPVAIVIGRSIKLADRKSKRNWRMDG